MTEADRLIARTIRDTGVWGALLTATTLADVAVRLALPAALAGAVDAAVAGDLPRLPLMWLIGLLAATAAVDAGREFLTERVAAQGTHGLRRVLLGHVLALGLPVKRRFGTGDLLGRTLESTAGAAGAASALASLVTSAIASVGGLVALFLIDVLLGLLFVVGAPFLWWITRWLIRRVGVMTTEYQRVSGGIAARFVDAMCGVRTIRASGTVELEVDRVLAPMPQLVAAGREYWDAQRKVGWQMGLLVPLLQVGALAIAGYGVLVGRVSPGELLAAQIYLGLAMGLLKQTVILSRYAKARGSAERVVQVLAEEPPVRGVRPLPPGRGALRLHDVHVQRGGRPVLRGIDLDVPAGHAVALVGTSGSGKTTLTEVAGGLVWPDAGQALLDGVPLTGLAPAELRKAVAYAFERPHLLGATVADAIGDGVCPPSEATLDWALRASASSDFVRRLPQGSRTPVSDLRLSGGELQRLGIARALARGARVVVLDDATSSVDTATESEITDALDASLRGTTRLIVAHRMSTAARADLVVWLEGTMVRAIGPHERLLEDPDYQAVFQPGRQGVPVATGDPA